MEVPVFTYRKVGNLELYDGRDWFVGHDVCPYCRSALTDARSFHVDAKNIAEGPDGNTLCLRCGCRGVKPNKNGDVRREEGLAFWRPAAVSPINCLLKVATCECCGWWYAVQDNDQGNNGAAVVAGGVLERFELGSAAIPLEVLQTELARRVERITGIHPKRMEDLVGAILRGVFDCEVQQLGYSKDGGVDLLVLQADQRIAVQVKRRESPNKKEPVRLVREFLGASLLAGHSNLIFVTSASGFTKGAERAAADAVAKNIVDSFDLIDGKRFADMLVEWTEPVWFRSLKEAVDHGSTPEIPNPFEYTNNGQSGPRE